MTSRVVWACVICGFRAEERPPKHCPTCGVNSGKFRMLVDRAPAPTPKAIPVEVPEPEPEPTKPEKLAS